MGDSTDGSSSAAQSAQVETTTENDTGGGFFRRLIEAISPADAGEDAQNPEQERLFAPVPGMINLRRMRVEDVAVPKADIVALAATMDLDEVVDAFRTSGFTRLPVYDGTLDTPVGFLHLKDLALKFGFNGSSGQFVLRALVRPLLFVPPSMPIGVLLTKMQTERRHMALVIDEYGGVDGLVTIEDLIEQVVGEIEDEHDQAEDVLWVEEAPGCFNALAKAPLEEFEGEIGRSLSAHEDIDAEEVDTLGGLVFMLAGRVPARGELVVHPDGTEFEVVDADPRRIKRLRVLLTEAQQHVAE
ncbi:hemolysin family protein [Cognatishimia maritima]|uniref:Magnesium and cobalt transporter n=1 Tax=Cognatishimia maritima TaxID=870908 RepID=A0A1M5KAU8_9RHOB|nr:hemolysin family protein [Cognatishimia maritima]SHG49905.1 magnesium and cobalt transporter [Cognatishimia maritima]